MVVTKNRTQLSDFHFQAGTSFSSCHQLTGIVWVCLASFFLSSQASSSSSAVAPVHSCLPKDFALALTSPLSCIFYLSFITGSFLAQKLQVFPLSGTSAGTVVFLLLFVAFLTAHAFCVPPTWWLHHHVKNQSLQHHRWPYFFKHFFF